MFNKASASQCIEKIKSSCKNLEQYHLILSDLILKNSLISELDPDSTQNLILTELFKSHPQAFREFLFKTLHNSWYVNLQDSDRRKVNIPLLAPRYDKVEIPAILVWGYDLRLQRTEEIHLHQYLEDYDLPALAALWEAIKIGRIRSVKGLKFDSQSDEAWEIICNGIINSSLTSFYFAHRYGTVSTEIWKSFWNALKQSSIIDLNFRFADFHSCNAEFWEIFFNGLGDSNLQSISFESMNLSKLSTAQWSKLYQAIARSKLVSVDLTCNHLDDAMGLRWNIQDDDSFDKNCPESWKIIGNLIGLSSLKHVKLLEQSSSLISDKGWRGLCDSLKKSRLEKLEFSVDVYRPAVTEDRWLYFLQAIEKLPLKSLVLHTASAGSVSTRVFAHLCKILDQGIRSFKFTYDEGFLAVSFEEWKCLGKIFKENGIEIFNMGAIELKEENNFMNFSEGLKGCGIKHLYLNDGKLGSIPPERWKQLGIFIREEGIRSINLTGDYSLHSQWDSFCHFIVNSEIRELVFSASSSNGLQPNDIVLLSQAIQKSQLESFSFEGLQWNMKTITSGSFAILCDGIRKSKIFKLIHPWVHGRSEGDLSEDKHRMLKETLKAIEPRALYRKSLEALCAHSLMKSNAMLTKNGVEFEVQGQTWLYDLTENQKNILESNGIW